jgi:ParB/RepB/Spo0J family partition protein
MFFEGYDLIARTNLRAWPKNPRKTIDQAKVERLAASIKAIGIQQPLVVNREGEVIAGQRRLLAAELAGLELIPCMVRDMDDDQALEVAIAENAAREDVSPIEEAESIDAYLRSGRTVEQAADRFGHTPAWVERRVQLLGLTTAWRIVMISGQLPLRHAELLARLPVATQDALAQRFGGRDLPSFLSFEREVQLSLRRLAQAPFSAADESYPGGSCAACPKRSDKQRDMFSDEQPSSDAACLDPACWSTKVEHRWEIAQKDAKKRKLRVLTAQEAGLYSSGVARHGSEYVEAARAAQYSSVKPVAIARTEDGLVVELVRAADVDDAHREAVASAKAAAEARKAKKAAKSEDEGDEEPAPARQPAKITDRHRANVGRVRALLGLLGGPAHETIARRAAKALFQGSYEDEVYSEILGVDPGALADSAATMTADEVARWLIVDQIMLLSPITIDELIAEHTAPSAPADDGIEAMVARYADEIAAARTAADLGAAWEAIVTEDHRASLPKLATLWMDRAAVLSVSPAALRKLRKAGGAPGHELVAEDA